MFRGGFWIFLGKGLDQFVSLIRLVVLARLLAPSDFGLMGIATVFLGFLECFSQTGFQTALVQRRGNIRPYLDPMFTVQLLRGCLLTTVIVTCAPLVADFFQNSGATSVLRGVAVMVLLNGIVNPATVFFQRELDFRKQFYWTAGSSLVSLLVAIGLAFAWRNVWALVISAVTGALVRVVTSYFIHPYRPHFAFDWDKIKELSGFGRWVFSSNILVYISTNLDTIIVGRLVNTMALGYYQMAFRLANLPATQITHVYSTIAFPVYAELQANPEKLRRVFFGALSAATLIGLPIVLTLIFFGQPAVILAMTSKWEPLAPLLVVLALYGLLRMVVATGGPLFTGLGFPSYDTSMNLIRTGTLVLLIYPFTVQWGATGAAWVAVASLAATLPYWLGKSAALLGTTRARILSHLSKHAALALAGVGLPAWALTGILPIEGWTGFLSGCFGVVAIYSLVLLYAWRRGIVEFQTA